MRTTYRFGALALGLVLASMFGIQRAARAGDAGRILAGVAAGALVYELLDDDCCCHTGYACRVHAGPRYRSPRRSYSGYNSYSSYGYDYYAPRGGVTVVYRSGGYIPLNHYYAPPKRHKHRSYKPHGGGHRGRGHSRGGGRCYR